jgi:hypothetical protein
MVMLDKRIIDMTAGELLDLLAAKINEAEDKGTLTTSQLASELKCSVIQIKRYHIYGMNKDYGCKIKHNCWNLKKCKEWLQMEYPKLLAKSKGKKLKRTP